MRVVLDTNLLIAAFIAHGVCNELLEHCAVHHDIVLSPFILSEFKTKLVKKFRFTVRDADKAIRLLKTKCVLVKPAQLPKPLCRDKDDDKVIGTALAGSCDCIVTGDKDLLVLKMPVGIPVIPPAQFWEFERNWLEQPLSP